jgi:hypothetical protein
MVDTGEVANAATPASSVILNHTRINQRLRLCKIDHFLIQGGDTLHEEKPNCQPDRIAHEVGHSRTAPSRCRPVGRSPGCSPHLCFSFPLIRVVAAKLEPDACTNVGLLLGAAQACCSAEKPTHVLPT